MISVFNLLRAGVLTTALDIDNALYLTAVVDNVPERQQNKVIVLGLLLEFLGRLGVIALILWVFGGREMTITLFGQKISVESMALIGAGIFLFIRSVRELNYFFRGKVHEEELDISVANETNLPRLLLEVTVVNMMLSIDTIIAITGATTAVWQILFLLSFSALIRLVFVRQITAVINRFPSLNIIILAFLILIGLELFLQGLGLTFPEEWFNFILLMAVLTAVIYERRAQGFKRLLEKLR